MKTRIRLLLFAFMALINTQHTFAQEAYAVLEDSTLIFYYDNNRISKTGIVYNIERTYKPGSGQYAPKYYGWYANRKNIAKVVVDTSFSNYDLSDIQGFFLGEVNLKTIEGMHNLNIRNATSMGHMFSQCSSLKTLDLSGLKTSNVKDMSELFNYCYALTTIKLNGIDTKNVTNMSSMFKECKSLSTLEMDLLDVSNVENMNYMFMNCYTLEHCDLSHWNSKSVVYIASMFAGCKKLKTVNFGEFCIDNATSLDNMFYGCSSLITLDLNCFNTEKVTSMGGMFGYCQSLRILDLTNFDTSNVQNMGYMFRYCDNLETIYVSDKWSTSNLTYLSGSGHRSVFEGCQKLVGGCGTVYNDQKRGWSYAHVDEGSSNPGYLTDKLNGSVGGNSDNAVAYAVVNEDVLTFYYDELSGSRAGAKYAIREAYSDSTFLPGWYYDRKAISKAVFDTSFVSFRPTNTACWFYGCSSLDSIEGIDNLKTEHVVDMSNMFYGCNQLRKIDVGDFVTNEVEYMQGLFYGCTLLKDIDVSCFNTRKVEDFSSMFKGCSSFEELDVSGFETAEAKRTVGMFDNCKKLKILHLTSFNTSNVILMDRMFADCEELKTIYVKEEWSIDKVESGEDMFLNCTSLAGGLGTRFHQNHTSIERAHIDGGTSNPGYLTKWATETNIGKAYAVLKDETLTFYYDDFGKQRHGSVYNVNGNRQYVQDWYYDRHRIKKAVIDSSFADYHPTSTAYWFYNCDNMLSVDSLKYLSTDSVKNMTHMFRFCYGLIEADVSHFETSKVTDMSCMFCYCSNLSKIDVSSFNTENVTNMEHMFHTCPVDTLNLRSFETKKVCFMNTMFAECKNLKTIYASKDLWCTENVVHSSYMFVGCNSLMGGCGTKYDGKHTDKEYAIIDEGISNPGYLTDAPLPFAYAVIYEETITFYYDCFASSREGTIYTEKEFGNWDRMSFTKAVFDESFAQYDGVDNGVNNWFCHCELLESVTGLEHLNFSHVTSTVMMFQDCRSLTELDLSPLDTKNVVSMDYMFERCHNLVSLNLSRLNTHNVQSMSYLFRYCDKLTTLDLSSFDTSAVTDMGSMFRDCTALKKIVFGIIDTHNLQSTSRMFRNCCSLPTIDLSCFDTSILSDASEMFYNCNELNSIYCSNKWIMKNVEESENMFYACNSLIGGCGTLYDAQHIDYTYAHIDGGPENPGYLTYKAKEIPTDIEYVEQGDEKGIWYNMQGIRIKEPTKAGIYMKDGKKIVVK